MVWCIPKIVYHLRAAQAEGGLSFRWQQDFRITRFRKHKRIQGPLRVAVGPPGLPGLLAEPPAPSVLGALGLLELTAFHQG